MKILIIAILAIMLAGCAADTLNVGDHDQGAADEV